MTYVNELVQFGQAFDFKMTRDPEFFFYERSVYESVDDTILVVMG